MKNTKKAETTVVVGLSGGVDSSVAAHLLLKQGYRVVGMFMRNWNDAEATLEEECPWIEDSKDALLVAEKLGIPFHVLDFSAQYKERIVNYMFREYAKGRTPNPDILCNREIKFDLFLDAAKSLGADYVATGHYCRRIVQDNGQVSLLEGKDANKDQSYFLCQVSQAQLQHILFPIGDLEKTEVRAIAKAEGLVTADKKDSQGLCFIGKVKLPEFLKQSLKEKQGVVMEIPRDIETEVYRNQPYEFDAKDYSHYSIGSHIGAHFYTVGQRKGLGIGGTKLPLFVLKVDTSTNTVFMGQGEDHPLLWRSQLFVLEEDIHWIREDLALNIGDKRRYKARIRYRQKLSLCTLVRDTAGLLVYFDSPQKAIAKGQFIAWYEDDELIGSGEIQ